MKIFLEINRFSGEDENDFYPEGNDSDGGNDEPVVVGEPEKPEIDESIHSNP